MGVETETAKRSLHPEPARAPTQTATEARQPGVAAPGWGQAGHAPPPFPGLTPTARAAPDPSDLLRQLASPRARQDVVLRVQHSHGNRDACRVIARSRVVDHRAPRADVAALDRSSIPDGAGDAHLDTAPRHDHERHESEAPAALEPFDPPATESDAAQRWQGIAPPYATAPDPPPPRATNGRAPHGSPSPPRHAVIQRDWLDALGDADGAVDAVSNAAGKVASTVAGVASDALDAVSGLIDSAIGQLRSAFNAIVGRITGAWETVKSGVTGAVEGAIREASGFLGGIGGLFSRIGAALTGLDADALRAAWGAITGAADAALAGVRGLIARVTATVDGLWSGLKGMAEGLIGGLRGQAEGVINRLPGPAQGPARSLWNAIERQLTSAWRTIESGWTSLRTSALKGVNQLVARVAEVATSIKKSVVSTIIDAFDQIKVFFAFIKRTLANPDSLIEPIVQEVTGRLQGLPDKAKALAQTKAQEQSASGPGAASAGPAAALAAPQGAGAIQRLIQRDAPKAGQPRKTLGPGQVLSGCWDFITDKLAKLWGNLGATVKEMVIGVLDPRAIWSGLKQDWEHMTKELSTRVSRFESIRTDSWDGFWEDLRRFLSNLVDFPLIVWRTVNAMLGRLSVYIGLAIILGGAIAGAIAGGTGGAVFGSVFPGAGTAGGGLAGVAAGAWAGAQAGYAAAETVGLVLLVSFVAAEQLSIVKALNDLLWVPQIEDEQNEDFNLATDSTIAIATAGLLMLIAFIGIAIAKRVWALVRGVAGRFRPKPKVVEPDPPGPKPADGEPGKPKPNEQPGAPDRLVICRMCDPMPRPTRALMARPLVAKLVLPRPRLATILRALDCTTVPGVPKDLVDMRAKLSPEMRQFLDGEAAKFFPDPANPTPDNFNQLRAFMDDAAKKGGGDLDAGLRTVQAQAQRRAALEIEPHDGVRNAKAIQEADAILQAEQEGLVKNARRPNLKMGEPDLDFVIDGGYADVKTPFTKFRTVAQNAADLAKKVKLYDANVKVIVDLKLLTPAEKTAFIAEATRLGVDFSPSSPVKIINGP